MIELDLFARGLATYLRGGTTETVDDSRYQVTGQLDTGPVIAKVEIWIPQNFADLKRRPPPAWCHEPWMRDDNEWHNSAKSGMCWALNEEWRDELGWEGKPMWEFLQAARRWLLLAVPNLISRHYYGHLKGLKKWMPEWESWGHYSKGAKEYGRQKGRTRQQ